MADVKIWGEVPVGVVNLGTGLLIVLKTKRMDEIIKIMKVASSKDWVLEFCNVQRLERRETMKECRVTMCTSQYRQMCWW